MVKVSFNSALAQKEAAKKEEENSQVLIVPPDAKVRAAGHRAAGAGPAAQQPLRSAPLRLARRLGAAQGRDGSVRGLLFACRR